MTDFIHQSHNWWIPLLTFIFISGVAGLVGYINGWKTAAYFFAWNLVALISGALAMGAMVDATAKGLDSVFDLHQSTTIEVLAKLLLLISLLLVTNIFAFGFYWIFRKNLKAEMKENHEMGNSNTKIRWTGATIGVVTALPMSFGVAAVANTTSANHEMDHFYNSVLKGLTGGVVTGLDDDQKEAVALIADKDTLDALKNLDDITKMTTSDREKVSKLLETAAGPEMLKAMANTQIKEEDKKSYADFLTSIGTPTEDQKIALSAEAQDRLKDTIIAVAIKGDATPPGDLDAWWTSVKTAMFKLPTA